MVLQREFQNSGYRDILSDSIASEYGIHMEDLFDTKQPPEELVAIYISEQRDELFIVLLADAVDINALCDRWDKHIQVFTMINAQSAAVEKLKYNIVQLIVYSGNSPDKSKETNLMISRKIMIRGNLENKNCISIDDNEVIELPFHMIPGKDFQPDQNMTKQLKELLPEDETLMALLESKIKKVNKADRNGTLAKTFSNREFELIKEWLEK